MKWDTLYKKSEWLYRKITDQTVVSDDDKALEKIISKIGESGYLARKIKEQQEYDYLKAYHKLLHPRRTFVFTFAQRMVAAAVLVAAVGISIYLVQHPVRNEKNLLCSSNEVVPGQHKAYLIKNNGEQICLRADTGIICETNGTPIRIDSFGLSYTSDDTVKNDETLYNTLIVPRGGEYNLILADGSKVWLNADSHLKYPIAFTGETREVFVSGEAYFEIKKQSDQPFIVKTSRGDITVLGTQFNVSDYPEKEQFVATLISGKIAYNSSERDQIILEPSQQLIVDREGHSEVKRVDTRYATSWKEGMFLFESMRLEDILLQLSRWYDIRVVYLNEEIKDLHFSGDLSRFKNIDTFIKMFEESSKVRCALNDRTLIVGL